MTCGSCACFSAKPCHIVRRHVDATDRACAAWHRAEGPNTYHPAGELVYLASPYSHKDPEVRQQRFEAVCEAARRLLSEGVYVYSPIAHCHPIAMAGDLPTDFAFWSEFCRVTLSRCTRMVVLCLPGWDTSVGIKGERVMAAEFGIPVEEMVP